jgi:hypothetical protein
MPLTIPLTLWIVYSAEKGNRAQMAQFTGSLLTGLSATVIFTIALWLSARAGLRLAPMLAVGYLAWAATLGVHYLVRTYML